MRLERQVDIAHPLGTSVERRARTLRIAVVCALGAAVLAPLTMGTPMRSPGRTEDRVRDIVRAYALEALPLWARHGYDQLCPQSIDDLNDEVGRHDANDVWGTPLVLTCSEAHPPIVISAGPDRAFGTRDDISSLE